MDRFARTKIWPYEKKNSKTKNEWTKILQTKNTLRKNTRQKPRESRRKDAVRKIVGRKFADEKIFEENSPNENRARHVFKVLDIATKLKRPGGGPANLFSVVSCQLFLLFLWE